MDYDAIIAGGSFAGLAAAAQLRGRRVLLVEPHAIGTIETSACGTLLAVLEQTGTLDSLIQVHDYFALHLHNCSVEYPLPYPFCTFDYSVFCERLLAQTDAEVLRAAVIDHQGHRVHTTKGTFEAEILIDATGWRAALATGGRQKTAPHRGKSFGLETVIPTSDNGLHLYYDSTRFQPYNLGWLFPIGAFSRAGFASYRGDTRLADPLTAFVGDQFGQPANDRYGGYFPYRQKQATTGRVFCVGDAAGQCLPFTGEGIRPALYYGKAAGCLARRVLEDEIGEDEALASYRKVARRLSQGHTNLLLVQKILPGLPMGWIEGVAGLIQRPVLLKPLLEWYWNLVDPKHLS